jgi:hypothetical protein
LKLVLYFTMSFIKFYIWWHFMRRKWAFILQNLITFDGLLTGNNKSGNDVTTSRNYWDAWFNSIKLCKIIYQMIIIILIAHNKMQPLQSNVFWETMFLFSFWEVLHWKGWIQCIYQKCDKINTCFHSKIETRDTD